MDTENTLRQITKIKKGYIFSIAFSIILLVSFFSIIELNSNRQTIFHQLREYAYSLIHTVSMSSANTVISDREIEALLSQHLIGVARNVQWLDSISVLTNNDIIRIAEENDVYRINLFDKDGIRIKSNNFDTTHKGSKSKHTQKKFIEPILNGKESEIIIGLKESRFEDGFRYAVAVKRSNNRGGAIVVNLDAESLLEFRQKTGFGKMIQDIGNSEGIAYIMLQNDSDIIAANKNVNELGRINDDEFLKISCNDTIPKSRLIEFQGEKVFEVLKAFNVENNKIGLFRIGLSIHQIEELEASMIQRAVVVSAILIIASLFVIFLIIKSQNIKLTKELQKYERHSKVNEKLIAMGELASGVAHEVRNPLNTISMIGQRIKKNTEGETIDKESLGSMSDILRSESSRVNGIIEQFLKFSRPPKLKIESIKSDVFFKEIIEAAEVMSEGKNFLLKAEIKENEILEIDIEQFKQVMINLIKNAFEAVETGGIINIEFYIRNNKKIISISDNGKGIEENAMSKIFNLYYTTKDTGTGLGLSIVQQIVSRHNGIISVESKLNKGTKFIIEL
jgi:signal transduction histidine kinase